MSHISLIFGLPFGLTDLCRDICVDLSGRLERPARAIEILPRPADPSSGGQPLDCLGSLADAVIATGDEHMIAVVRAPDRALAASVTRSGRRFLLVLDDPRYLALLSNSNGDFGSAIRGFSLSAACLLGLMDAGDAIIVTPGELLEPTPATFQKLLSALGLPTSDHGLATAEQTVTSHLERSELRHRATTEVATRSLQPEYQLIAIDGALAGYTSAFVGGTLSKIVATRGLFSSADTRTSLDSPVIDATGRARLLYFGPYLSIPAGTWSLRVIMAFSQELADSPFTLDAVRHRGGVTAELGRVSFTPGAGRYAAHITFEHREPDAYLEFRLSVDKSVFDGRISLGYAELTKLDRNSVDDFEAALDWRPD